MQPFYSLLSKIQKGDFSPLYLLSGTEPYFIDQILKTLILKLVDESSKDFDFSQFYGKENSVAEIIEAAKRYPMLSNYNVVVIKEAQLMSSSELDLLAKYAENPMTQSILIICFKNKAFDKRKKLFKNLEKNGDVLNVKPLFDNQLVSWIQNHSNRLKIKLSPLAIQLLANHVGSNLSFLDNELKKVRLFLSDGEIITEEHIEKHIGISKIFNSFELQRAIGLGNFSRSFQIIQYLNKNTKDFPLVLTLNTLHNYFQKLFLIKVAGNSHKDLEINPFFFGEYKDAAYRFKTREITLAMELIMEADLKLKGITITNAGSKEILEELLIKLFLL